MLRPSDLRIEADCARAHTLPSRVYHSPTFFEVQRERVFATAWHFLSMALPPERGSVKPVTFMDGVFCEPLLLVRGDDGELGCLSNVCTHRGNLLVTEARVCKGLRCGYHGRRFDLNGALQSAPGFEEAWGFPCPADNLPSVEILKLGPVVFASLEAHTSGQLWLKPVLDRIGHLPLDSLVEDTTAARAFEVNANWALYCDNYLEGLHIPYVHPALNHSLDAEACSIHPLPCGVLQIGEAAEGVQAFELPPGHPEHGRDVAAFYFWLFPTTMINVYPWGISVNVVEPLGVDHTRVRFFRLVWPGAHTDGSAGAALDDVEHEDEAVVEAVHRGTGSRLFKQGRYAPKHEAGVHHFHRLLTEAMARP